MMFAYFLALSVSIFGMVMIDRRFGLAFFTEPRRTAVVLAAAMIMFVLWDIAGITLGIFRTGSSNLTLDILLLPELPLEELLFLFLLSYLSLLSYLYTRRVIEK